MSPFVHQNTSLAIALHFAGAHIIEVRNIYTADMLRRWGCRSEEEALRAGHLGTCHFHHQRTPDLDDLLIVFTQQMQAAGNSELSCDIPRADIVRLVTQVLKDRKALMEVIHDLASAWIADTIPEMPADFVKWVQREGAARAKYKAAMDDYEARRKAGERIPKPSADQVLTPDELSTILEPRTFSIPSFKMAKAKDVKSRRHLSL
jgi:hypothetical protein